MMLGEIYLGFVFRLAMVVVPVAVYFLILGLLNSRRRPQMLSGRQDFALLIVAMSPLVLLPAIVYVGASLLTIATVAAGLAVAILLLSPSSRTWVIYNLTREDADSAIKRAVRSLGVESAPSEFGTDLPEKDAKIIVSEFPLLKNTTIRIRGGSEAFSREFANALANAVGRSRAETSPTAVALLLVATAMLIAPLSLMAQNMPQIVRLISDMMH